MDFNRYGMASLVGAGFLNLFLASEFRKEVNPWAGFWEPESTSVTGKATSDDAFRVFLTITDGNYGRVASYWTCGVAASSFAHGKMLINDQEILLIREDLITRVREQEPCGRLGRMPNHRLAYDLHVEGGVCRIEFVRTENANTIFDLLGWK